MSIVSQVDQTYPLHGKVGQGQGAVLGTRGQSAQPPCAPETNNMLLLFTGSLITAKLPLVYKNKPHRVESLHPTLSETALYKGLLLHQPT